MQTLRITGAIAGVIGLCAAWFLRFRLRRLRNLDWLIASGLSLALLSLGAFPDAFNALLALLSFEKGGGERIVGLLVLSNLIVYALVYVALARGSRAEELVDRLVRGLAKREFRKAHAQTDASIYVIIPAYNEGENIRAVLKDIPEEVLGLRTKTLVVIDGATDNTGDVVQQLDQAIVSYTINRGGGSALKAGYEIAVEDGAEIVVTLDADGQHLPEEIPILIEPILEDEADVVNGSRVLGSYEKDSRLRTAGVLVFNWLVSFLTMTRITDCSNAFRAIRASELSRLDLRQAQFHTSEFLIEALKKGLRVREVPITVRRRLSGKTKKPPSFKYALGFAQAIVRTWLR